MASESRGIFGGSSCWNSIQSHACSDLDPIDEAGCLYVWMGRLVSIVVAVARFVYLVVCNCLGDLGDCTARAIRYTLSLLCCCCSGIISCILGSPVTPQNPAPLPEDAEAPDPHPPEPEADQVADPWPEPEVHPVADLCPEPEVDQVADPWREPEADPVGDPRPEPEAEPVADLSPEPEADPVADLWLDESEKDMLGRLRKPFVEAASTSNSSGLCPVPPISRGPTPSWKGKEKAEDPEDVANRNVQFLHAIEVDCEQRRIEFGTSGTNDARPSSEDDLDEKCLPE